MGLRLTQAIGVTSPNLKAITETGDHYSSYTITIWSLNDYNSVANFATEIIIDYCSMEAIQIKGTIPVV